MGYDQNFLNGHTIPLPQPSQSTLEASFNDGEYVGHSRYSLLFNKNRGFAFCSAHNIDGQTLRPAQLSNRRFRPDPLINPRELQIENDRGYKFNDWDRGHLARRKSLSWGLDDDETIIAEQESDFYSNIVPQHENLHDDAWGEIEDWMLEKSLSGSKRACVFTGPVFTENDPSHKNADDQIPFQIPAGFWKVIVVPDGSEIKSASFLVWQRDYDSPTPLPFAPILEQVRLTTIEVITGLSFHDLSQKDVILFAAQSRQRDAIASIARAQSFGGRIRNALSRPKPSRSNAILSSADIIF